MRTSEKPSRRARLVAELKTTFVTFVYLAIFFGAFATYRRLLLAQYQIPFFQFGSSLIEALVLAKVIVLGRLIRLGERYSDRPLIIPTLYKSLWFGALIVAFSILEQLIVGWFHGKVTAVIVQEVFSQGVWEILSRSFVKLLALLPFFAMEEIGRVLGEGKLFKLFFTRGSRQPGTDPEPIHEG